MSWKGRQMFFKCILNPSLAWNFCWRFGKCSFNYLKALKDQQKLSSACRYHPSIPVDNSTLSIYPLQRVKKILEVCHVHFLCSKSSRLLAEVHQVQFLSCKGSGRLVKVWHMQFITPQALGRTGRGSASAVLVLQRLERSPVDVPQVQILFHNSSSRLVDIW